MTADEAAEVVALFAEIVASRPAGHFDEVMPLLRRYCELAVESRGSAADLDAVRVADDPHAAEIELRFCAISTEMCEIAEILGLLPGDRGKPAPRAN